MANYTEDNEEIIGDLPIVKDNYTRFHLSTSLTLMDPFQNTVLNQGKAFIKNLNKFLDNSGNVRATAEALKTSMIALLENDNLKSMRATLFDDYSNPQENPNNRKAIISEINNIDVRNYNLDTDTKFKSAVRRFYFHYAMIVLNNPGNDTMLRLSIETSDKVNKKGDQGGGSRKRRMSSRRKSKKRSSKTTSKRSYAKGKGGGKRKGSKKSKGKKRKSQVKRRNRNNNRNHGNH